MKSQINIHKDQTELETTNDHSVLLLENQENEKNYNQSSLKYGIDLKWENLNVSIKSKKKNQNDKVIIENNTGFARKGEVLAIMGPSGAGKTTLMGVLGQRVQGQKNMKIEGKLMMNNQEYDQGLFSKNAAFILQHDLLMQSMTVQECIEFSAKLKVKGTQKEINNKVKKILKILQLEHCKDTLIGGQWMKGISGGERKRVSIGVELVSDPQVLLLDEPTSGLDSFTAWVVINQLKLLAKQQHKTVIFTIHSPNSEILDLFDRILLMKRGQIVFQGSTGKYLTQYMEDRGEIIPRFTNPCDYFMQLLQKQNISTNFNHESYLEYQYDEVLQQYEELTFNGDLQQNSDYQNYCFEFKVLLQRAFKCFLREPMMLAAKILQIIFLILILDILWFRCGNPPVIKDYTTVKDFFNAYIVYIQNLSGGLFIYISAPISCLMATVTLTYPIERAIFIKEQNSKLYRISSYFLSRLVVDLPYTILFPLLFGLGVYYALDLEEGKELTFLITLMSATIVGNGMGLLNGSLFKTVQQAAQMTAMWLLPLMLFGGYFSSAKTMPKWVEAISYISPYKYFFEVAMTVQFENSKIINIKEMFGFNLGIQECLIIVTSIGVLLHVLTYISLRFQSKTLAV